MKKTFTVAFFGHRYISNLCEISEILQNYITKILNENDFVNFIVGRNGDFDQCVATAVRSVQENYRNDKSVLILMLPYQTAEYTNNQKSFEKYYGEIEISNKASLAHPKSAIEMRNKEMADRSDLVICYITKQYGGAFKTVQYARKTGKKIINIADEI